MASGAILKRLTAATPRSHGSPPRPARPSSRSPSGSPGGRGTRGRGGQVAVDEHLLGLDRELLERFDAYVVEVGFPSRRHAIRHALEVVLAQHAAHEQRAREVDREPNQRPEPWAPAHSADTVTESRSRPLTSKLTGGF